MRAGELLRDHVANNGGAQQIASAGGVLEQDVFAARCPEYRRIHLPGWKRRVGEGLRQNGLQELIGKPASEVLLGIVGLCGGTNGSIDAVDARSAASRLMDDLCKQAVTAEDVELILKAQAIVLRTGRFLMKYFGYYLYEQFCRLFFAQLVKKHGEQRAESFLDDILDFIQVALRNQTLG